MCAFQSRKGAYTISHVTQHHFTSYVTRKRGDHLVFVQFAVTDWLSEAMEDRLAGLRSTVLSILVSSHQDQAVI